MSVPESTDPLEFRNKAKSNEVLVARLIGLEAKESSQGRAVEGRGIQRPLGRAGFAGRRSVLY